MRKISKKQEISDYIREKIKNGIFAPGDRLPITQVLADQFEVSVALAHKALVQLVREGLISRDNSGSVVNCEKDRLKNVAICCIQDAFDGISEFQRSLAVCCREILKKQNIDTELIHEPDCGKMISTLNGMALLGKVQGVIFLSLNYELMEKVKQLTVPFSVLSSGRYANGVNTKIITEKIAGKLADDGIKKMALFYPLPLKFFEESPDSQLVKDFFNLLKIFSDVGIEIPKKWIFHPEDKGNMAKFAYENLGVIFSESPENRPDMIFAANDYFISGILLKLYGMGVKVPDDIKLLLLVNEGLYPLLPVPCYLLEFPIRETAEALIGQLEKQYRHEVIRTQKGNVRLKKYQPVKEKK